MQFLLVLIEEEDEETQPMKMNISSILLIWFEHFTQHPEAISKVPRYNLTVSLHLLIQPNTTTDGKTALIYFDERNFCQSYHLIPKGIKE